MRTMRHHQSRLYGRLIIAALLGAGYLATAAFNNEDSVGTRMMAFAGSDCLIKGNISLNTGERIYHVPGQEHYDATRVSKQYGERWFCSEQEASEAGWRRARR